MSFLRRLSGRGKPVISSTAAFQDNIEFMRNCYLQYLAERRAKILAGETLHSDQPTVEQVSAAGDLMPVDEKDW